MGALEDCVLDAELCALGPDGYSNFSALRRAIFKAPETLVLFVFDLLWREYRDLRGYALETRKKALASVLEPTRAELGEQVRYVHEVAGEGPRLLNAACQLQWEGIVSKRRDAPYRAGKREGWVKSKCRPSESIVIGGWVSDNGRFSYLLGGVREADGSLRDAGSIKGGYGAQVAADLWPRIKPLEADKSPFRDGPRKTGENPLAAAGAGRRGGVR